MNAQPATLISPALCRLARAFLVAALWAGFAAPAAAADLRELTPEEKAQKYLKEGKAAAEGGDLGAALDRFQIIMRRYADSSVAAEAQYEIGQLYERNREFVNAFEAYQGVIDGYRESDFFTESLAGQYRVAVRVHREYQRDPEEQAPGLPERYVASEMMYRLVQSARRSEFAPLAQYQLAVSLQKEKLPMEALKEHENMILEYPDHHYADDSSFQIAYILYTNLVQGSRDQGAVERAEFAFEDFLASYPDSVKAPEARFLLERLHARTVENLAETAETYRRLGKDRAARMVYRDLLRSYPQVVDDEKLARRVEKLEEELRQETAAEEQ
jgi:outer membrane protein assembly factor BamD (BamD/ComL family)